MGDGERLWRGTRERERDREKGGEERAGETNGDMKGRVIAVTQHWV